MDVEEKVRRHLPLIAVFVLAVAYWLPVAPLGINLYDEGLRLYGADRILDGERPYRDFFASYGPGEYYWSALLFALFGKQLIVFRLGCLVAGGVVAVSLFSLGKHAGLATSWALLPVAGLLLPVTTGPHLYICGPALALALAGGAVITGSARPGRGRLFAAGALFGSAAVFRLDFGAFGAVAGGAAGFVVLRGAPGSDDHRSARRRAAGGLVFLLLGVGSVVLPAYAVFVLDDPYRLVHSLIVFPAEMLPYRHLAYLDPLRDDYWRIRGALANGLWLTLAHSATRATVFAVPPAFVLVLLGGLSLPSLRTRVLATPRRTATLVFVVMLALGLTSYALARFDFYHVLPLFVVSACGVAILVGSMLDRPRSRAMAVVGPVLVSAAGLALAGMHYVNVARAADYVPLGVERAAMIRIPPAGSAIAHAVADIGAAAAGRILIACTRHDRVHANPVALYFLSGRPSATYLHDFYPHVTTTRRAQERIVRDLRTHDVQTVLAWRCGLPEEPNLSRTVRGVSILDDFLRAEFTAARRTDRYELLVKRGGDGVRRPE